MTHSLCVRMGGVCEVIDLGRSSLFAVVDAAGARKGGEAADVGDERLDEDMIGSP